METQIPRTPAVLLGCLLAPALLLAACTASNGTHTGRTPSPGRTGVSAARAAQQEKELGARAQSALGATDSAFASGLERASDGLYVDAGLAPGAVYRLTVVCVGTGTVAIDFAAADGAERKPVPCDGTQVLERFTAKRAQRVDVPGVHGATGMMAWRIDKV
ncbi:hypothetical protein [Streptomyces sp. NPDC048419]|uniref:hypothetical protein n=1 Tax=Streptomyces sp. NPDC048419 TaxID=3365547 RepID=UPI003717DEF0